MVWRGVKVEVVGVFQSRRTCSQIQSTRQERLTYLPRVSEVHDLECDTLKDSRNNIAALIQPSRVLPVEMGIHRLGLFASK